MRSWAVTSWSARSRSCSKSARCHGGVAGRGIAVRRRSILVIAEHKRPYPRRASWSCMDLEDAADNFTARKHVEIVLVPVARNMPCGFPPEHCRLGPSSAHISQIVGPKQEGRLNLTSFLIFFYRMK